MFRVINKKYKIMKWIVLVLAVMFAASCSNDTVIIPTKKASVKIDVKAENITNGNTPEANSGLKAASDYKRDGAPDYVAGVDLVAHNNEYTVPDVSNSYTFASDGTKDVVLAGLTIGNNTISATGVPANAVQDAQEITMPTTVPGVTTTDNLDTRASEYSSYLLGLHGLYADYNGSNSMHIVAGTGNTMQIDMKSNNHRCNVVLENRSPNYKLKLRVYQVNGSDNLLKSTTGYIEEDNQVGFIHNEATSAVGIKEYKVEVDYCTPDGTVVETLTPASFTVNPRENYTKLYRFKDHALTTGDVTVTFTWEGFTDENHGHDI